MIDLYITACIEKALATLSCFILLLLKSLQLTVPICMHSAQNIIMYNAKNVNMWKILCL